MEIEIANKIATDLSLILSEKKDYNEQIIEMKNILYGISEKFDERIGTIVNLEIRKVVSDHKKKKKLKKQPQINKLINKNLLYYFVINCVTYMFYICIYLFIFYIQILLFLY